MEAGRPRKAARARVRPSRLYSAFNIVFALLFFGIVVLAVLQGGAQGLTWYWLLLAAGCGVGGSFLVSRLFGLLPQPARGVEIGVVVALFVLFAAAQVFLGWGMRGELRDLWNADLVQQHAVAWAKSGVLPDETFLLFPGRAGAYVLLGSYYAVLSLFGVTDFVAAGLALNVVAIDAALVMLYFCGRRLFGAKRAIFLLLCAFFTLPFLLYAPIWGPQTLTLVFPVGVALMWLKARALWRQGETRRAVVRFCVLSALAGLGAVLSATVLIVWVAVVIDLLVLLAGKGRVRLFLAGLAIAAAVLVGGTLGVRYSGMLPRYDYQNDGMPLTYWVMMGLSGDGGYNESDQQLVWQVEGRQARADFVLDEMDRRLNEQGILGFLRHLGAKLGHTFGDGTYGADAHLSGGAARPGPLGQLFAQDGRWHAPMLYVAFATLAAALIWMAVAALKALARGNNALTFMRVAILGLVLFLLVWQAQACSLVNYLPLILLCAVEAAPPPLPGRRRAQVRAGAPGQDREPDDLDAALLPVGVAAPAQTQQLPAVESGAQAPMFPEKTEEPAVLAPGEEQIWQTQPMAIVPGEGPVAPQAGQGPGAEQP